MRCALINSETKRVVNIILADPSVDPAPEDHYMINITDMPEVQIGWSHEGGEFVSPPAPPAPVIVPSMITPRQCRLMLLQLGLLASVEQMIAQQDEATKIAWEYATEFRRDHPLLLALSVNLNLDEAALDNFFIEAAKL